LEENTSKGKGKVKKGKGGDALQNVKCSECGVSVDLNECRRLLEAEGHFVTKLKNIEDQIEEKGMGRVLEKDRIKNLLKYVCTGAAGPNDVKGTGPIGPQHWQCEKLFNILQEYYGLVDMRAEQRQMLECRIEYHRKAYPGSCGSLAWQLEEKGELLLRHVGFGLKPIDGDNDHVDGLLAQVIPSFEESLELLARLFGTENDHYTQCERKINVAKRFIDSRSKRS